MLYRCGAASPSFTATLLHIWGMITKHTKPQLFALPYKHSDDLPLTKTSSLEMNVESAIMHRDAKKAAYGNHVLYTWCT